MGYLSKMVWHAKKENFANVCEEDIQIRRSKIDDISERLQHASAKARVMLLEDIDIHLYHIRLATKRLDMVRYHPTKFWIWYHWVDFWRVGDDWN